MRKVKIMQITHDLDVGGLQSVVVHIAKHIDKRKFDISVCVLKSYGPFARELGKNGIRVIGMFRRPNSAEYDCFWRLGVMFRRERPDIIHTHNTQPFLEGVAGAILGGVPIRIHTDHARQFPDKKRYMLGERLLSHFTDKIVAVSDSVKCDLMKYENISPDRIVVVPNGIEGERFKKSVNREMMRKCLGIDKSFKWIVGFVGRLSSEKGLIYLLEAMRFVVREFPHVILLIVGEGELSRFLRQKTEEFGIMNNVLFLGMRSNVEEILQVVDVFVLPSEREGLSLSLLEAAAASVPIVATDVGGSSQIVHDGFNGHIVKPKDSVSLYLRIKELIADEELRGRYGRNSRKIFDEGFSVEKMVDSYEEIYMECLMASGIN